MAHKDLLTRQFTVMALVESEVMVFTINDLVRMRQEFLEVYESLFFDSFNILRKTLMLKLKAMKVCQ